MKKSIKVILFNILCVFILLFIAETISYSLLDERNIGFFVNFETQPDNIHKYKGMGFDEVDPLLGWRESNNSLSKKGFKIEYDNVLLETSTSNKNTIPLKIFITGGSTSDMGLNNKNWPLHLKELLEEKQIYAKIYVAATGGYNSGQELLRTINEAEEISPTVHISYSGANEAFDAKYVTVYEKHIYDKIMPSYKSKFLPNTIFLLKSILSSNNNPTLTQYPRNLSHSYWYKNMKSMHGLAKEFNYEFIGILQPVLGSGAKYTQKLNDDQYQVFIDEYEEYYPKIKQKITPRDSFISDFTGIFDDTKGNVFNDNCHIHDEYQKVVALHVFNLLLEKRIIVIDSSSHSLNANIKSKL